MRNHFTWARFFYLSYYKIQSNRSAFITFTHDDIKSEINLSEESDGITELSSSKYNKSVGKSYFSQTNSSLIDLSITPNRPDCLGIRGIARDLAASGLGKLKKQPPIKIRQKFKQPIKVSISKEKYQGCAIF